MAAEKIDALELNVEAKLSVENLEKLIESLKKVSKEVDNVGKKKPKKALKDVGDGASEAANGIDKFLSKSVRLAAVIALFSKASDAISDGISKALTYEKTLNMFTVSMGKYAENATKYGEAVSDALGIDIAGWQNAQGIFQTLITGFGVSGDKAAYMSQNLTQLSYDIASFYGITNEEAQNKLKSAISGRLEPIRKLGWDLSQSKLTDLAKNPANYGKQTFSINEQTGAIEANTTAVDDNTKHKIVNFNQLTQQEKVQLRYIALMTQVTQVQGAYAKTLSDPVNQMRIFKEQLNMTSRELGNVFIPALNQVLPYLTAFAKLAAEAFRNLANLFGFEIPDMSDRMDISSVAEPYNDVVEATGRAAKNAKKLKDYTIGIDELNVLKKPDDTYGGGSGVTGQSSNLNNLLTPGYDFLSKAMENSVKNAKAQLEKFFGDLKKHPIEIPLQIFKEGASILGENFWTAFLGKTPEELAADAQKHGKTIGEEFVDAFIKSVAEAGSKLWEAILGSPEDMQKKAEEAGITVEEAFTDSLSKKLNGELKNQSPTLIGDWLAKLFGIDEATMKTVAAQDKAFQKQLGEEEFSGLFGTIGKWLSSKSNTKTATGSVATYNSNATMKIKAPEVSFGNTSADEARKAGERISKAYAEGVNSGSASVKTAGNNLYKSGYNGANNDGKATSSYKYVSYDMAKAYATELASKSNKQSAYNAGKELSNQGLTGNKSHISGFKGAGEQSGAGYVAGVNKSENIKKAKSAGATIASNALKKLKEVLGIHSPSRAFGEAGMNSVLGYANYMEKYTYLATDAAENMAKASVKAVNTADSYYNGGASVPTTTNAGYGIGAANTGAMATLASQIYNAVVSGMSVVAETMDKDTKVIINGKEVFTVVQAESRKNGVAISNGAFST